eukprot:scaffold8124_cov1062-Prasinococcus_capsulatus_cf.AAC.1
MIAVVATGIVPAPADNRARDIRQFSTVIGGYCRWKEGHARLRGVDVSPAPPGVVTTRDTIGAPALPAGVLPRALARDGPCSTLALPVRSS